MLTSLQDLQRQGYTGGVMIHIGAVCTATIYAEDGDIESGPHLDPIAALDDAVGQWEKMETGTLTERDQPTLNAWERNNG
jgi:hypothetical protein